MSDVAQRTPTPPGVLVPVPSLARTHSGPGPRPAEGAGAPQGLQLRHLRYLVVLADAGTFHRAAKRLFIAQSTLSQQIRRLEEIVGSPLLRVVLPWRLEESLAVAAAARLQNAAAAAQVDLAWLEMPLDAESSLLGTRRAHAGLGWLTTSPETLPAALEAMVAGEFEPEVWIPAAHPAAHDGAITLAELAGLPVIHGRAAPSP